MDEVLQKRQKINISLYLYDKSVIFATQRATQQEEHQAS